MGLALLSIARRPGEELTLEDIAAWCGCPASTIHRIETAALRKAFWCAQNGAVRRALLAAMAQPKKQPAQPFRYKQQYGVIVICEDEGDQKKKFERLTKLGFKIRVVTV